MRPITTGCWLTGRSKNWPLKVKGILVHELNYGQYVLEVERVVAGQVPVALYAKYDNEPATPAQLLAEIKKPIAARRRGDLIMNMEAMIDKYFRPGAACLISGAPAAATVSLPAPSSRQLPSLTLIKTKSQLFPASAAAAVPPAI